MVCWALGMVLAVVSARPLHLHRLGAPNVSMLQGRVSSDRRKAGVVWAALTEDLIATLVLRDEPKNVSFEEADALTKKSFVEHCPKTFDVPQHAVPDDVVEDMCNSACASGDCTADCSKMVERLWEAYDEKNLKAWCEQTYSWFETHTKPKCQSKCKALLCKQRCDVKDQVRDLQDKETSLLFKLNQAKENAISFNASDVEHAKQLSKVETFNATQCQKARKELESLEEMHGKIGETWGESNQTFISLLKDEARYHEVLKVLYDANASKADIDAAKDSLKGVLKHMGEVRETLKSLNKRMRTVEGIISKKRTVYQNSMERLGELEAEWKINVKKLKAQRDDNLHRQKAVEEKLVSVRNSMVPLNAALKADTSST